jgi:outer membrane protein assembly factor BamA
MRCQFAQLITFALAYASSYQPLAHALVIAPATVLESPDIGTCSPPAFAEGKQQATRQVTIAEFTFDGDLSMSIQDQGLIAMSLKQRVYSGDLDEVTSDVVERTRRAWQDRGYFKVQAQGTAKVLTSSPGNDRVAFAIQIDEGEQYRLEGVRFRGNDEIKDQNALRSLIPMKDGDTFSREKVAQGLDNLRFAYRQLGHLNFTSVPNTQFDEARRTISLDIDVDEGKKFYVSGVSIVGHDERVLEDSLLKQGEVYDRRLVDLFLQEHASLLPSDVSPDSRVHLQLDQRAATVAITFDFRRCPVE